MMHSQGFTYFALVISIFLLQLFCLGTFRLLSSFRNGINRHQIHTRMELFKYNNITNIAITDILTDGSLSSLPPVQSTSPKGEYGGGVHSHAYSLVRAWQEHHLSGSCAVYRNVLRVAVLQLERHVKTDVCFGIEILNGSLSTDYLRNKGLQNPVTKKIHVLCFTFPIG